MPTSPAHAQESHLANPSAARLGAARRLAWPVALAAASSSVQAHILYTDIEDITVDGPDYETSSIYFDLDRSGGGSVFASTNQAEVPGADYQYRYVFTQILGKGGAYDPSFASLRPGSAEVLLTLLSNSIRPFGTEIFAEDPDTATVWTTGATSPSSGTGYIGLRLRDGDDAYYGWVHLTTEGRLGSLTIHDFAINTIVNEPILAGQISAVPEPSFCAAMAGLLAGSAAMLRRRQQKRLLR